MTWSAAFIIAWVLLTFGRFIDVYHNRSTLTRALTNTARDSLVRLFLILDEVRPSQIAKKVLTIRLRYMLFVFPIIFIFLLNLLNQIREGSFWPTDLSSVLILPNLGDSYFSLLFPALLLTVLMLPIYIVFIATLRAISRRTNDAAFTITLIPAAFIVFAIPFIIAYFTYTAGTQAQVGIILGPIVTLIIFLIFCAACLPLLILLIMFFAVLILKYITVSMRWLTMRVIDAATSPETSPFTYFGGLFAICVVAMKAISNLLP